MRLASIFSSNPSPENVAKSISQNVFLTWSRNVDLNLRWKSWTQMWFHISQLTAGSCMFWGRMLSTLCTSVNCSKCAYFTNGVGFTFRSVSSGTFRLWNNSSHELQTWRDALDLAVKSRVGLIDWAGGERTSHAVYLVLLLFHLYSQKKCLICHFHFRYSNWKKPRVDFFGLVLFVSPVLGF